MSHRVSSLLVALAVGLTLIAIAIPAQDESQDHATHDHDATSEPTTQADIQPSEEATSQPASDTDAESVPASEPTSQPTSDQSAALNSTCPVMASNAVNPEVSMEYEGQTVLFCCADCIDVFNRNPERYVSSLPQFAEESTQ